MKSSTIFLALIILLVSSCIYLYVSSRSKEGNLNEKIEILEQAKKELLEGAILDKARALKYSQRADEAELLAIKLQDSVRTLSKKADEAGKAYEKIKASTTRFRSDAQRDSVRATLFPF